MKQIDEAKSALGGLRLRKTELEKDCAMRSHETELTGFTHFQKVLILLLFSHSLSVFWGGFFFVLLKMLILLQQILCCFRTLSGHSSALKLNQGKFRIKTTF
ncbi:unnamed protein product [Gongylonema pulchrum]|uniref:Uncharacterized protein n=1 Tax=Gongylonema pulchrum TaxID=637853 RepID=A0A183EA13_9BILA|nr:unnamed protein product [Gongylonema pulchrum]